MPISYLQIENLTKSYGDRVLFDGVTFGINQGDKIGLIAKNGTGKTTLLRIIAGAEAPDSGAVTFRGDIRVGVIEQTPILDSDSTVIEACLGADTDVTRAINRYEHAIATGAEGDELADAIAQMDATGAWDYDERMKQLLHQLRIEDINARVGTLSGGQQKRIAIASAIISNPHLIILDEPTNHLDIEIIEWLQDYLTRQNMTLLMVTHDRYFLDAVCNKIIEIDNQQIYTYEGNYAYYLRRRAERIEAMSAELAKMKNTLRREQEWMRRQPQARAGKAKYRIDAFYSLKDRARAINLRDDNVALDEMGASYIGSKIFEAHHISKRYGDKVIIDDLNYVFARYEKLGIIGRNGVGKSTLVKMLQGIVQPDSGRWEIGETVRFGYYSQEGIAFDERKKVIDAVTEIADDIVLDGGHRYSPMQFLQRFLFSPADQQKYIHTLSGGERCRLHLATVLMRSPNFLILDEPTNDLDIVTLGILEEYLREFHGCLIVVSHDRFFLDSIVDHLWVLQGDGDIKDFPGSYSDYRQAVKQAESEERRAEKVERGVESGERRVERKVKMTFKQRKEFEQLTSEIDTLTAEKKSLEELFNSGDELTDVAEKAARYEALNAELDEKEMRWLELSELE